MSKSEGQIAVDMVRTATEGHVGGANGTALSESAEVRSLRSVVESEGVRVNVERDAARRVLSVKCTLKWNEHNSLFEITETEIEDSATSEMLAVIIGRVREASAILRGRVVAEMLQRGELMIGQKDAARLSEVVVQHVAKHADPATCERLAIELMQHVERVPR